MSLYHKSKMFRNSQQTSSWVSLARIVPYPLTGTREEAGKESLQVGLIDVSNKIGVLLIRKKGEKNNNVWLNINRPIHLLEVIISLFTLFRGLSISAVCVCERERERKR